MHSYHMKIRVVIIKIIINKVEFNKLLAAQSDILLVTRSKHSYVDLFPCKQHQKNEYCSVVLPEAWTEQKAK